MNFWSPNINFSPNTFVSMASKIMNVSPSATCPNTLEKYFRSFFGCSPLVCTLLWNRVKGLLPASASPLHLLWGLLFLKTYSLENVGASIVHVDPKTYRKWVWKVVYLLPDVKVISFQRRMEEPEVIACCEMSVDGVDMRIREPKPFSSSWYSHKFKGPGVRYEVFVAVHSGMIIWLHGPFACGAFPDQKIFNLALVHHLNQNEKVIADQGYSGESVLTKSLLSNSRNELHKRKRARHENLNRRLNTYRVLSDVFRHAIDLHQVCTFAVSNIVQLSLEFDSGLLEL